MVALSRAVLGVLNLKHDPGPVVKRVEAAVEPDELRELTATTSLVVPRDDIRGRVPDERVRLTNPGESSLQSSGRSSAQRGSPRQSRPTRTVMYLLCQTALPSAPVFLLSLSRSAIIAILNFSGIDRRPCELFPEKIKMPKRTTATSPSPPRAALFHENCGGLAILFDSGDFAEENWLLPRGTGIATKELLPFITPPGGGRLRGSSRFARRENLPRGDLRNSATLLNRGT